MRMNRIWYHEEKSNRSDTVEMLDAVNLPIGRRLKRNIN